jgi:hypothetical protein
MTKWVALAFGALLALGGAVAIWNGLGIIQTERGWAYVIAGSAALAGGVVTFALFLLIREVQALRANLTVSDRSAPVPVPPRRPVPAIVDEAVPEAPVFHEPPAALQPTLPSPPPADTAPPSPPVFEPVRRDPLPHESPVFAQVFPPVDSAPTPPPQRSFEAAARAARSRFQTPEASSVVAAAGIAATGVAAAAAWNAFGRSRVSQTTETKAEQPDQPPLEEAAHTESEAASAFYVQQEPEPEPEVRQEPEHEIGREPEPEPEPVLALVPDTESFARLSDEVREESRDEPLEAIDEPLADQNAVDRSSQGRDEESEGEEPATVSGEAPGASLSPGQVWLERALAREEGRRSPALEWLRARQFPGSSTLDPARQEMEPEPASSPREPEQAMVDDEAPAPEPVRAPQAHASTDPAADESETSSQSRQGAEPAPERGAEPDVIGRYSSGGSDFTLYSDGSIDAQTEQGLFRFESMAELRAHIEAQNAQA